MTEPIRGIVVSVDYDDLLSITLPRAMRHLSECLVITAPRDEATKAVARSVPNVRIFETDAFWKHGAAFNKGYAMEQGFDVLSRHGWILIWDADTVLPDVMPLPELRPDRLYGARRRVLESELAWRPDLDWSTLPVRQEAMTWGYFQLFHAGDPHIRMRPWYDPTFTHAAGCDDWFQTRWPAQRRVKLPGFEVLHIGPLCTNWFGRASERADGGHVEGWRERLCQMDRYIAHRGWAGQRPPVARPPGPFVERRVEIPKSEYPL
jgi:hypothetical protein